MDIIDLLQKLNDVASNLGDRGEDGVFRPSEEFENLKQQISELQSMDGSDAEAFQEMETMLDSMVAALSDPDIAKSVAESMARAHTPRPEIFDAIDEQDVDAVKVELTRCDVNQRYGEFDSTALYHAMSAMDPSIEIMNFLLDAGADPRLGLTDCNVLHGLGFTVFRDISADDLAKVVRRCVELGADIEQRTDKLQWTPLISAVSEWNEIAAEALLMAGADITARAGQVDGVCFSGADSFAFADGHEPTMEVLRRYRTAQWNI